jgi:hypothetical protein
MRLKLELDLQVPQTSFPLSLSSSRLGCIHVTLIPSVYADTGKELGDVSQGEVRKEEKTKSAKG